MPDPVSKNQGGMHLIRRNIYRTGIATLIILGMTEILLRLLIISPSAAVPDAQLGWRYKANAMILHSSEGYARNRMNILGLNDEEPPEDEMKRKIVAIGDSFTEALQVPRESNFTSIAEKLSPCINVLNAGRSGTTVVHYPLIAKRLISGTSFDDIVIVFTSSDIADIEHANFRLIYNDQHSDIAGIEVVEKQLSELRQLFDPVLSRSSLATYLKNRIKQANLPPQGAPGKEKQATSNILSDNKKSEIQQIFQFVLKDMKSKAPTYALYIPTFEYLANGVSREIDSSMMASSIIHSAAGNAGVPFGRVDGLADSYRLKGTPPNGFPNNNIRRGHLNATGHDVVAQSFVDLIDAKCTI